METISVSKLKAQLSGQLKKVERGVRLVVVDHKRPVAMLSPVVREPLFVRVAEKPYAYRALAALTKKDPLGILQEDRADRW